MPPSLQAVTHRPKYWLTRPIFSAYAVYNKDKPETIIAANLNMWNSTMDATNRPYTALSLLRTWNEARVSRLTFPGIETAGSIMFAGQYVDSEGG